jgi:hypothetical protein
MMHVHDQSVHGCKYIIYPRAYVMYIYISYHISQITATAHSQAAATPWALDSGLPADGLEGMF